MSFRAKLLVLFTTTVVVVTALVAGLASTSMRRSFERLEQQRTDQLLSQFRHEFARRGDEVSRRVEAIAARDSTLRMAGNLGRPSADYAPYVNEAGSLAAAYQLDFLELIAQDGAIVSSAQWPARFGYKEEWITAPADWNQQGAFLKREELPDGSALALVAVREVRAGDSVLYVAGGERLDRSFLSTLSLPSGMRAMLYLGTESTFSPQALTDASGPVAQAEKLAPVVQQIQQGEQGSQVVWWSDDPTSAEAIHGIPLKGRDGELLGVLLVGSSQRDVVAMEKHIRLVAMLVGAAGVLLGLAISGWASARATRPVEQLADAAREVAAGNWWAQVPIKSNDEFGELASAFNLMTRELSDQRERLVQAERVAAWRELARRLAHELKNPLFPLQITVENLLRAKEQNPAQFEEVFRESAGTLLAEIANLRAIVQRFSDFARMPAPELQSVQLNDVAQHVLKVLEPQFTAADHPPIATRMGLDPELPVIQADPELINRALQNLVLNAIDAMPSGGTLTVRTSHGDGTATISVSDTGTGLTREECERLFTPYYTTKQHGTGLGLAIVQSVVSDHHGKITVESEPGRGSVFRIELPLKMPETNTHPSKPKAGLPGTPVAARGTNV
ncbi:MAG TPA: ATP-binding protein [Terriglobales bacterium]|nr:ATP-binding protein [Terriglobales bacterium]